MRIRKTVGGDDAVRHPRGSVHSLPEIFRAGRS